MLDFSYLQAGLPADVSLISSLPALPSLQYCLLPFFAAEWNVPAPPFRHYCAAEKIYRWLRRCAQLTMCDNLTFSWQWSTPAGDFSRFLLESELPSRLVALELRDAPGQAQSVLLSEGCLFKYFPCQRPAHQPQAPCAFLSLAYLACPLGVTETGRLIFPLLHLRWLSSLHSLLIRLRLIPQCAVWKDSPADEKRQTYSSDQCVLSQLSTIRTLRWVAIKGAKLLFDYIDHPVFT